MQFYAFIEQVKEGMYHNRGQVGLLTDAEKLEMVGANPFIFVPKDQELEVPLDVEKIDLPFKNCFFEYLGGSFSTMLEGGKQFSIKGIYVKELSPQSFDIFALINVVGEASKTLLKIGKDSPEVYAHFMGMLNGALERISLEEIGYAKAVHKVKVKTKDGNTFVKINKVVYVSPKKMTKYAESSAVRGIDWSHQWSVRGHWRNIPGRIGKDRDGLLIANYSWVKNHIKGPEHAPLIHKVRVIGDSLSVE